MNKLCTEYTKKMEYSQSKEPGIKRAGRYSCGGANT